jgi:glycerate dehydrogenase
MAQADGSKTTRIVFLDRDTLSPETRLRSPGFPHELEVFERTRPDQVAGRIVDADIVITNKVPVRGEALEGAKSLRLVAVAATGYDVVDVKACAERDIAVANIRNYAVNTVPEHTFALILALRRSIIPYRESVVRGRWQQAAQFCYFDYPIHDLAGATLGIVGDGALGKSVAEIAKAFGMTVLFSDYKGTTGMGPLYTPFDEVMRTSDIITLHAPLLPSTRGMIGAREFALMEKKPLLINTARGGLVDEEALAEALERGRIGGAGFDVVSTEPPPPTTS